MKNDKYREMSVLITGASRGIGRATAEAFAEAGCQTIGIVCDRDTEGLARTEAAVKAVAPESVCIPYVGDVADEAFVAATMAAFVRDAGSIDVLVNNAGISVTGLLQDLTLAEWNRLVAVNLTSVFLTSKAAISPMLRAKRGEIINVSSMWGRVGASCEVAYSATKGGVIAFTQALSKELAPSGIAVNCVAPGVIDTDMNGHLSADEKTALAEEIPAGRFATPREVGELIVNIATAPTYMTGQCIGIDGGFI